MKSLETLLAGCNNNYNKYCALVTITYTGSLVDDYANKCHIRGYDSVHQIEKKSPNGNVPRNALFSFSSQSPFYLFTRQYRYLNNGLTNYTLEFSMMLYMTPKGVFSEKNLNRFQQLL